MVKQAPFAPMDFLVKLEEGAGNLKMKWELRILRSLICLMTYASLRYADTLCVFKLRKSGSAICWVSTDPESKDGSVMQRATPSK